MKTYPKQMQVYMAMLAKAEKPTTKEQAKLNARMVKACKSKNRLEGFVRSNPNFLLEKVNGVESIVPIDKELDKKDLDLRNTLVKRGDVVFVKPSFFEENFGKGLDYCLDY